MRPVWLRTLLVALLIACGGARAQNALRIAAVVNDEVISVYDLDARLSLVLATSRLPDRPENRRRLAPEVLRSLIDGQLKLQEARRLDIQVTKDDIIETLDRIERNNKFPEGGLDDFLNRRGVRKNVLIGQVEADIAWAKVIRRRMRQNLKIGEDEIDEVLAEIEANKGRPEHRISEIFLSVDDPKDEPDVRQFAERLFQRLRAGAKFEAVAQNFSQSATAAVGGDLGWIKVGQLARELEAVLTKLRSGQVSPPVRTVSGYHILFLRDRRQGAGMVPREATVTLQQVYLSLPKNASDTERERQMELAGTIGERATDCREMDKLGSELGNPLSGNTGRVKLSSMPAPLQTTIRNLKVGEASRPQLQGDGIIVLMVCTREDEAATAPDRDQVSRMLTMRRMDSAARQYLRDLRRAAFVDVRM